MNPFPPLILSLQKALQEPLPGEKAHALMAPGLREPGPPSKTIIDKAKKAGVCILIYQNQEDWHTALIERTQYEGVHSGQMAFPGGKKEIEDKDLIQTALRETEEEVGIRVSDLKVLGQLSPIYIPPSNTYVEPTMAYFSGDIKFKAQPSEVAEIVEVKLQELLDPNNIKEKMQTFANGVRFKTPYFELSQKVVWGATAIIISEWIAILNKINQSS